MNTEIWASIGTIVTSLALVIVPALIYTWYALEHLIGDKKSYESAITQSNGAKVRSPVQVEWRTLVQPKNASSSPPGDELATTRISSVPMPRAAQDRQLTRWTTRGRSIRRFDVG